jgi:hypothetical protein
MGALITIRYNSEVVTDDQAKTLAEGIQQIVKDVMSQKDVFVYTDKPAYALADPIEVFIQVNQEQVTQPAGLTDAIASRLGDWKKETHFSQPININVHPVEWHYKIGI